jgi:hypothetical protein
MVLSLACTTRTGGSISVADAAKIAAALKLYREQREIDKRAMELLAASESLEQAYLKAMEERR